MLRFNLSTYHRSSSPSLRGTPSYKHQDALKAPVGIQHLLEVYDDYPLVVKERDGALDAISRSEEAAIEAERLRDEMKAALEKEREERAAEVVEAANEKARAEKALEKRVRGELDPQIKELEEELKMMTDGRDKLTSERDGWKAKMEGWLEARDRLDRERKKALNAEKQAEAERQTLDVKMRDLVKGIMEATVTSSGKAATTEKVSTGKGTVEKPVTEKGSTPIKASSATDRVSKTEDD